MALIDCPECKKGISNKAISCPHCGYPIEKFRINKKKNTTQKKIKIIPDPRYPLLPEKIGIGKQLSFFSSGTNITGIVDNVRFFNYDFLISCEVELSIHEKGIKIKEKVETPSSIKPTILNLHFSLIISLDSRNLFDAEMYQDNENDTDLNDRIFCSNTSFKQKLLWKYSQEQWKKTPILVINYWNTEYKQPSTLIIKSSYSKISRFKNFYQNAKQNYDNGIPNIPDKKGDNRKTFILVFFVIAFLLFILVAVIYGIVSAFLN